MDLISKKQEYASGIFLKNKGISDRDKHSQFKLDWLKFLDEWPNLSLNNVIYMNMKFTHVIQSTFGTATEFHPQLCPDDGP